MAPSTPAPTPWNTKAEQIVAGARRSYLNSQNDFNLSEREAEQEFGLAPGFNDYKANPYSRAALLEKSYLDANRGTINSAGLNLYSGSTSNALGSNRGIYGENRDQLQRSYLGAQGEIRAGRAKAAQERAEREQEAEWERIAAAEGADLDPEAAPAPVRRKGQAPKGRGQGTIRPRPQPKPQPRPSGGGGGNRGGGKGKKR